MLFNLIIFILFAAAAYFQYTQGLFSATISAILCVVAAIVAVSYHELITPFLMKLPEQADAIALVGLFAATFIVLRLIFDSMVPGNVRFPLLMDKIGSGVMGVIAGLFATGTLAIAAQSLPFGPAIGGYSRQDLQDRPNITVMGNDTANGHPIDTAVADELIGDSLGDPRRLDHLWLHQDDLVLAIARQVSDAGSALSNDQPLEEAHPDYVTELFGQRLGMPAATVKHVAVSSAASGGGVKVSAAWVLDKAPAAMDAEVSTVRGDMSPPDLHVPGQVLVALRVEFTGGPDMTDSDGLFRTAPANIRLKAGTNDYYPVGTLVGGSLLLENRPDDPLAIDLRKSGQTVDFVFEVNADDDLKTTAGKDKSIRFKDNSFLEVKRYADADVSGMELTAAAPRSKVESAGSVQTDGTLGGVIRKVTVGQTALAKVSGGRVPPAKNATPASNPAQNSPAAPAGGKQDNEFLPPTPGQALGL